LRCDAILANLWTNAQLFVLKALIRKRPSNYLTGLCKDRYEYS
jgi:hypothetical protein